MRPEKKQELAKVEKIAMRFTTWLGSVQSVIVHTILFLASFSLWFFGVKFDSILLILTTLVSLEAIYLALFIQMTVNRNTQSLEEVEEDIDEIQKDIDEVQENVVEIAEDVEGIEENIDKIEESVDDLDEDLDAVHNTVKNIDTDIDSVQAGIKDLDSDLVVVHANVQNIDADMDTVQAGIKDIDEDLEEYSEEETVPATSDANLQKVLTDIHVAINKLSLEVEKLKK